MIFLIKKESSRIRYILTHLFEGILGYPIHITSEKEIFSQSQEAIKISYGIESGEIMIAQESDILYEDFIAESSLEAFLENYENDFLTLSFVLLTRYQEYLNYTPDIHGRFPFKEDKIFKKISVLTNWVETLFFQFISENNIPLKCKPKAQVISTIDIDRMWRFQTRNPLELMGMHIRAKFKKDQETLNALSEYRRSFEDPYDNFDYLIETANMQNWESIFFIQIGKNSRFDKNISAQNKTQKLKIQALKKKVSIGIHPSYLSSENENTLYTETKELEEISQEKIYRSRQHYLRMTLPKTYKELIKASITEDYTMGFAEQCGFRAGTAYPYFWFNLEENKTSTLKVFPFCVMDVTLRNYMHLTIEESLHLVSELKSKIAQTGGLFIPIFHNQNLTEHGDWKGWRKVYEHCLNSF